jgi:hypothetical protein
LLEAGELISDQEQEDLAPKLVCNYVLRKISDPTRFWIGHSQLRRSNGPFFRCVRIKLFSDASAPGPNDFTADFFQKKLGFGENFSDKCRARFSEWRQHECSGESDGPVVDS